MTKVFIVFTLLFSFYSLHSQQKWCGNFYNEHSSPQYRAALSQLPELNFNSYSHILDIGCGNGKITETMLKMAPSATIEAIDASENMIKSARERYGKLEKVTFNIQDALKLDYHEKFDLVVSFSCAHWIKDKKTLFKGIAKALKPGGTLLIIGCAHAPHDPVFKSALELKQRLPWSLFLTNTHPYTEFFPLKKELTKRLLKQAKLEPLEIKEVTLPCHFKSKVALADWFLGWLGGISTLAALPQDQQKLFAQALVEQYCFSVSPAKDGSITYQWPLMVIKAQKPALNRDKNKNKQTMSTNHAQST